MIPQLVQLVLAAIDDDISSIPSCEGGLDFSKSVGLSRRGNNASSSKPLVGRQALEQGHGSSEVVQDFLRGLVVRIAGRLQGADAGTMLAPFVLPEALIVALVVFPILLHVLQKTGSILLKDGSDVCVLPSSVAVLLVRAIAVIWPNFGTC